MVLENTKKENNTTTNNLKTNKIMETPFLLMILLFSTLYIVSELKDKFKNK
jgi:hypothetical protein